MLSVVFLVFFLQHTCPEAIDVADAGGLDTEDSVSFTGQCENQPELPQLNP